MHSNTRSKRRLAAVAWSVARDDDAIVLGDMAKKDRVLLLDGDDDDDDGDVGATDTATADDEQAIPMEFPSDNSCRSGDENVPSSKLGSMFLVVAVAVSTAW